uniref:Transposase Tnp1/En/Spm-like domain-containing protein n=1 Tax=Oryza glaberrima TaxID=4538 RepID=I1Q914_ORYGL
MARSRRRRIVQSNEEYLSEEQTEEENTLPQLATPSEQETVCDDSGEGNEDTDDDFDINDGEGNEDTNDDVDIDDEGNEDTDVDINVRVENGAPETRGKTKLKDVWNLPKGLRIVVQCNDLNQAVGEEAGILGKFLGMIARNGSLCSLGYTDWRYVIGKREKNTNELKVKKDILKQVKERWRQYKAKLKDLYFDVNETKEANCNNVPEGVLSDQWIALVNHWMNEKSKNKKNCQKKKAIHTAGTKSYARTREEMRQKDPAKKNPHRAVVYVHTHKRKSDKNINGHVDNLKRLIAEQPALADASKGKTAWKGDALNQILGDDKPGRVHGLGLVPKPKQVLDVPTSRRLQNINLTTVEDNSSEDVMAIRLQMEKLERHVENNDAELLQLKEKATKLEKAQKNQRVYGDNPSQEICMFEEGNIMDQQDNSLMNTQSHVHDENLQPPTKHSTVYKNTQSLGQNHSGKQRKITSCANKRKGNLDQNELMQPGKSISSAYKNNKPDNQDNYMVNAHKVTSTHKNKENLTHKLVRPSLNKYSTASKKRQCNTMDFLTDNSTVRSLQEICHVEQENIVMNSQSHAQDEDKTPPTKHATAHKNKRTFGLNDHGKQMEIICAKKQQCSKMDFITDNSMEVDKING